MALLMNSDTDISLFDGSYSDSLETETEFFPDDNWTNILKNDIFLHGDIIMSHKTILLR